MNLLQRIAEHARTRPNQPALVGTDMELCYAELTEAIERLAETLRQLKIETLALDMDNGPAWVLLDLAALAAEINLVPIPPFFSPQQVRHCLQQAGVQAVVSDNPQDLSLRAGDTITCSDQQLLINGSAFTILATSGSGGAVPDGIAKITYTSGTTGEPKGVMLAWNQIEPVIKSLASIVAVQPDDRHLTLMPLAVLLENIAGLYVPLWAGATALLPSLVETGIEGAAGVDASRMVSCLHNNQATTALFTPHTLQVVVEAIEQGAPTPQDLRFAAVGGAPVSPRLMARAQQLHIPVFEGYGLSECASVTTLNTPLNSRPGSVGRPLPHLKLSITEDGEVLVAGNLFSGYLGEAQTPQTDGWWHTGDVGHLDADGFLYLTGRRRNLFITAYGRNVSPEWVERELIIEAAIAQAAIFGEARPWNVAVLVPSPGSEAEQLAAAVANVNRGLPDYARINRWIIADEPFTPMNGHLSGSGRIRRHTISKIYQQRMELLYQEEHTA